MEQYQNMGKVRFLCNFIFDNSPLPNIPRVSTVDIWLLLGDSPVQYPFLRSYHRSS